MKKIALSVIVCAATAALLTGCGGGASLPQNTRKYDFENQTNFVLTDVHVQRSITSSGIQQRVLEDGRLELVVNVRNRESRRIEVQIQCVFKDEQGFSSGDEPPWQTLILTENTQEAVQFVSMNSKARKYTVRVRQAR
ncbi:MAG: DUF1425 domain-containing protein [Verrucomicrobia bacterium]|nr:MAG: DUF1425 domain-containing protein [Verrucomicrobiota bacterium]